MILKETQLWKKYHHWREEASGEREEQGPMGEGYVSDSSLQCSFVTSFEAP